MKCPVGCRCIKKNGMCTASKGDVLAKVFNKKTTTVIPNYSKNNPAFEKAKLMSSLSPSQRPPTIWVRTSD